MAENMESNDKKKPASTSATIPLSDIFFMTLHKWPWIILSVVICVGIAYMYLLHTPTMYTRTAEILIKDESNGTSTGAEEFANLGLFKNNTNIQNEMATIKAKDLMEEVVKRMRLDIDYFYPARFHDQVAYGLNLPVRISAGDLPDESQFKLRLQVDKNGDVALSDLTVDGEKSYDQTYKGHLGDSIATPLGNILVSPTAAYTEGDDVTLLVNKVAISDAAADYNSRLKVAMTDDDGTIIKISIKDQSIQRADDVLNTIINIYNENWIREKNQVAVSTSNFINERLNVIESELGNVDSDISSYKSANLIPDIDAAASMYMGQSQRNQAAILEVNNQLAMARYIQSYLSADADGAKLLPVNTGLDNAGVATMITDYNDRLLERNALVAKSSEKNPMVVQLDNQLSAQRQAIVATIDNEIANLNTQLKSLRGNEAQTMTQIASNPTQAKDLLSAERQQKVKESLYLYLLQKREENELSQAYTAYNTRIVNRPGPGEEPPTPGKTNILAIAFLIGLVIPFIITFIFESLNTKVRGRKDVEQMSMPFVGEIPQYGKASKRHGSSNTPEGRRVVVKAGERDVINEAFRVLRTNMEFMRANKDCAEVIVITSFNPGSGKSFITMNLATTLALKKQRVLVIDGDLRHGSASAYISSPRLGMSNVLNGEVTDIDTALVHDNNLPTLQYLPIGTVPPNPTELLESPRFAETIAELRDRYDYILIDCPPIEIVADAQIIDRVADRTIFVLRAGLFERAMLPELEKIYLEKKYKNMAFILNGTQNQSSRLGFAHSYRFGYGYGYGYGYDYGNK